MVRILLDRLKLNDLLQQENKNHELPQDAIFTQALNVPALEFLHGRGMDINHVSKISGGTLLHQACTNNRRDAVEWLLHSGADAKLVTQKIGASDGDDGDANIAGRTSLHMVALAGFQTDPWIAESLRVYQVPIDAQDGKGYSALMLAAGTGNLTMVTLPASQWWRTLN